MIKHDMVCAKDGCGFLESDVAFINGEPDNPRVHCEQPMEISWVNLDVGIAVFQPFVTRNIHPQGKPLTVRNTGDMKRFSREFGVVRVDDPDLVADGTEIRRKSSWHPSAFMDMGKRS